MDVKEDFIMSAVANNVRYKFSGKTQMGKLFLNWVEMTTPRTSSSGIRESVACSLQGLYKVEVSEVF
jgi:hypothetical protein